MLDQTGTILTNSTDWDDPAEQLMWRIALVSDNETPPEDPYEDWEFDPAIIDQIPADLQAPPPFEEPPDLEDAEWYEPADDDLNQVLLHRPNLVIETENSTERMWQDWRRWDDQILETSTQLGIPPDQVKPCLAWVNSLAAGFYEKHFAGGWAKDYLAARLGVDIGADPRFRPGYAPAGNALLRHLRGQGVTDQQILAAGLAKQDPQTGRLYDTFRDRLMLPIIHDGQVLGFTARRNPIHTDADKKGPKYLNTADTALFHKGAQFYGMPNQLDGVPVIVEGALDAIAVTLACDTCNNEPGSPKLIGVAPMGTSLTEHQAHALRGTRPIIATDTDQAGQLAAARDYWQLARFGIESRKAFLIGAKDPAEMLETGKASELVMMVDQLSRPMVWQMIDNAAYFDHNLLARNPKDLPDAAAALVVSNPAGWENSIQYLAERFNCPAALVRTHVRIAAETYNADPDRFIDEQQHNETRLKQKLAAIEAGRATDPLQADPHITTDNQPLPHTTDDALATPPPVEGPLR
jgi:DNA primase catalytic core